MVAKEGGVANNIGEVFVCITVVTKEGGVVNNIGVSTLLGKSIESFCLKRMEWTCQIHSILVRQKLVLMTLSIWSTCEGLPWCTSINLFRFSFSLTALPHTVTNDGQKDKKESA